MYNFWTTLYILSAPYVNYTYKHLQNIKFKNLKTFKNYKPKYFSFFKNVGFTSPAYSRQPIFNFKVPDNEKSDI